MSVLQPLVWCAAAALLATPVQAQFVKGNEAVTILPGGGKKVETPPLPSGTLPSPCLATKPGCTGSGWRMVETDAGVQECTEIYARPGTCRPSTYGTEKRTRLWIVKSRARWLQCQYPDLSSKCVSTKDWPTTAVQ